MDTNQNTEFNNPLNSTFQKKSTLKFIEHFVITLCILISISVIIGWFLEFEKILRMVPNSSTMKFNTALVFLFSGINLFLLDKTNKVSVIVFKVLASLSIIIGTITLLEYLDLSYLDIDNLFVTDSISKKTPGRMSPATAIGSILTGIILLTFKSKNIVTKRYSLDINLVFSILSVLAVLSFLLLIPSNKKTILVETMAIHTSILFLLISYVTFLKEPTSLLNKTMSGKLTGSKLFREILPKIIIFPLVLGNILLIAINRELATIDFGVVVFTLLIIIISITYTYNITNRLNENDVDKSSLQSALSNKNIQLSQFKKGIDQIANIVITDLNGKIKYVNSSLCETCYYSEEELIGKNYSILNSGYHKKEYFKEMYDTINKGEIWNGDFKNKKKDGTFYFINSSIIPFKDKKGNIIEFMAINNTIDKPI